MAIQFARIKIVSRKDGGNACLTSAYNARSKVVDEKTGEVFNFTRRGDNVYHKVLLPQNVDKIFQNISTLSNAVEKIERKSNSQLLKEVVIALPDDQEFSLKDRINITHLIIKEMGWLENGLAVQMDIHKPHDDKKNWHAHLLVQTRRFTECGMELGKKARDLNPVFKTGKGKSFIVPEEDIIHEKGKRIINDYAKKMGYSTRVDVIGKVAQEHIGPVRMRSIMNEAVWRNELRKDTNIKYLKSGKRVLESITRHMSVFNKSDLSRAVKIVPNVELRTKLVEEALAHKSIVSLYDDNGKETGFYTTKEVRAEELKILRLGGYIAESKNVVTAMGKKRIGTMTNNYLQRLIDNCRESLTTEQHKALSYLLTSESGVRILRGRAGAGKSYVLGNVVTIAKSVGVNVVGLAPTHKAKEELAKVGYEQNDTVKGMLFKLQNGRFDLPKGSLIVLDEAGMVGNDDLKELFRVAASRRCNIIMSGDEKQIASVQRGGMFEVFAEKLGSVSLLNIQRQEEAWGRAVAMAFSKGEVRSGISILEERGKINSCKTKDESMQSLIADWNKSSQRLEDRLILTVKNKDVTALNHGVRQYLKFSGDLYGDEISVAGNHYMKGDRILIKETDKKLGLTNGDFATIVHASKERFIISLFAAGDKGGDKADNEASGINDNSKLIEFEPSKYSGFRHGYATTIFKAQGASIKDVFVFHDGFAGVRNSYVALSRHVKNLSLYVNNEATKSINHLIKQMGHDPEIGSSCSYSTLEELRQREASKGQKEEGKGFLTDMIVKVAGLAKDKMIAFNDKHFINNEYYKYTPPKFEKAKVEEVLDIVGSELEQLEIGQDIAVLEKAVVGGDNISITNNLTNNLINKRDTLEGSQNTKLSKKERFYANVDFVRRTRSNNTPLNSLQQKARWDEDSERLRSEVKFKTEMIARNILGEPNKRLSDGRTLRFGENGKIAVRISGERMGSWYDFSLEKGGDMFALVQDRQGSDFKGAAEYLSGFLGLEKQSSKHLKLIYDHKNSDLIKDRVKERAEEERITKAKAEQVEKLYSRSKAIGKFSIAYKYLTKTRSIECESGIASDVRTTGIYVASEKESGKSEKSAERGKYLPAIVAYARDKDGNITGGQQIILDKTSGAKANIAIPKKSFGRIAGSFVNIGSHQLEKASRVTIIAEGLETGLSVKQALIEHSEKGNEVYKTLCSLGISNIKNYHPAKGEKIIIAADNDGMGSNTNKTIEAAKLALEEKGAFVEIVRPSTEGVDFNDILKTDGTSAIIEAFEPALAKQTATSLTLYLGESGFAERLDDIDKSNLAYIQEYKLSEEKIVDAYRKGDIQGKLELDQTRKSLEMAAHNLAKNKSIIDEARRFGYKGHQTDIVGSIVGMEKDQSRDSLLELRNGVLESYFESNLREIKDKAFGVKYEDQKALIRNEQAFLQKAYSVLNPDLNLFDYSLEARKYINAGEAISKNPEKLDKFFGQCETIKANNILSERELYNEMSSSSNINSLIERAGTNIENHLVRNALSILVRDSKIIKGYDAQKKEDDVFKYLTSKKAEYIKLKPYLENNSKIIDLEYLENRLKISEIYYSHKKTEPGLAEKFREEVLVTSSLSKRGAADALNIYKASGLEAAIQFLKERNTDFVLNSLYKQSDILGIGNGLKGELYIKAIAEEKTIMKYVEEAMSESKSLNLNDKQKNILLEFTNQKDTNRILESLSSFSDRKEFKENIADLNSFAKPEKCRELLEVFNTKGISAMTNRTRIICRENVKESINYDLKNIQRKENIELVMVKGSYRDKSEYFAEISKDEAIMKYVEEDALKRKDFSLMNELIGCQNEHATHAILKELKSLSERKEFKENIADLNSFAKPEEFKNLLEVFNTKGISAMTNRTRILCRENVMESIDNDLRSIRKKESVVLVKGSYIDKSEYLAAISKDETIMKHIMPTSEIGKEIAKIQETENIKGKSFDLER